MSDGAKSGLDLANAPRRVAVVGVSGNGKTTFSRDLASRLEVPYVELDALFHLSGWREADEEDFRRSVEQAMSSDGWVLDGSYFRILGPLVLERADTVVWLDQPLPLVLLRLVRRALRDIVTKRDLFNGNRQTWRYAFFVRDSLVSLCGQGALPTAAGLARALRPQGATLHLDAGSGLLISEGPVTPSSTRRASPLQAGRGSSGVAGAFQPRRPSAPLAYAMRTMALDAF